MNKKTLVVAAIAIIAVGVVSVASLSSAYAYQGDYTVTGPNHTEERELAMETVMANKDFSGWKTLMTENGRNPGVLRKVVTQEQFNKFAQAYELGKAGDTAGAAALRTELGLGNGSGMKNGSSKGNGGAGCSMGY